MTIERTAPSTLVITGEVDAHTAPQLGRALDEVIESGPHVRLDVRALTFMDSSGLRVLIAATQRTRAAGGDVTLIEPTPIVRRLLAVTGLCDHLTVESSAGEGGAEFGEPGDGR